MAHITRRKFMGTVAGAAIAAAASPRRVAANDRINVGFIGLGGQGKYNLKAISEYDALQVVALCDVDSRLAGAAYKAFPDVPKFTNYHEMLDAVEDLDAVVVSTPDHHHAFATVAALERGKHVYCEKPLTHSVWEARRVGEAAHAAGTATQMGNTGQASDSVRRLKEYLDAGAIGHVREVHVWTNRPIWPQGLERPEPEPPPESLDWDRWLGPAPEQPFTRLYHPFDWRGWWDFGTGALGDIACHRFAPIFYALELGAPIAVEAQSTANNNESYPSASLIRYEFPARGDKPPVNIHWYDGGLKPFRPKQLDGNTPLEEDGAFFVGDDGVIMDGRILPAEKHGKFPEPPETLPRSIGHWEEWIAACRGEAVTPGMNFAEHAGPLTEAVLLGNIALKIPKRLEWDSPNLRITNDDTANTHLRRDYREGWNL